MKSNFLKSSLLSSFRLMSGNERHHRPNNKRTQKFSRNDVPEKLRFTQQTNKADKETKFPKYESGNSKYKSTRWDEVQIIKIEEKPKTEVQSDTTKKEFKKANFSITKPIVNSVVIVPKLQRPDILTQRVAEKIRNITYLSHLECLFTQVINCYEKIQNDEKCSNIKSSILDYISKIDTFDMTAKQSQMGIKRLSDTIKCIFGLFVQFSKLYFQVSRPEAKNYLINLYNIKFEKQTMLRHCFAPSILCYLENILQMEDPVLYFNVISVKKRLNYDKNDEIKNINTILNILILRSILQNEKPFIIIIQNRFTNIEAIQKSVISDDSSIIYQNDVNDLLELYKEKVDKIVLSVITSYQFLELISVAETKNIDVFSSTHFVIDDIDINNIETDVLFSRLALAKPYPLQMIIYSSSPMLKLLQHLQRSYQEIKIEIKDSCSIHEEVVETYNSIDSAIECAIKTLNENLIPQNILIICQSQSLNTTYDKTIEKIKENYPNQIIHFQYYKNDIKANPDFINIIFASWSDFPFNQVLDPTTIIEIELDEANSPIDTEKVIELKNSFINENEVKFIRILKNKGTPEIMINDICSSFLSLRLIDIKLEQINNLPSDISENLMLTAQNILQEFKLIDQGNELTEWGKITAPIVDLPVYMLVAIKNLFPFSNQNEFYLYTIICHLFNNLTLVKNVKSEKDIAYTLNRILNSLAIDIRPVENGLLYDLIKESMLKTYFIKTKQSNLNFGKIKEYYKKIRDKEGFIYRLFSKITEEQPTWLHLELFKNRNPKKSKENKKEVKQENDSKEPEINETDDKTLLKMLRIVKACGFLDNLSPICKRTVSSVNSLLKSDLPKEIVDRIFKAFQNINDISPNKKYSKPTKKFFNNVCSKIFNAVLTFSKFYLTNNSEPVKELSINLFKMSFTPFDSIEKTCIYPVYHQHDTFVLHTNNDPCIVNLSSSTGSGKTRCIPFYLAIKAYQENLRYPFIIMTQPGMTIISDKIQDFQKNMNDQVIIVDQTNKLLDMYLTDQTKPVLALMSPLNLIRFLSKAEKRRINVFSQTRFCLDEIHQRSIEADVMIAKLSEKANNNKFPFQIIMMSATPDIRIFKCFKSNVREITLEDALLFPIKDIKHVANDVREVDQLTVDSTLDILDQMAKRTVVPGHILIFTSGAKRINNIVGDLIKNFKSKYRCVNSQKI